GHGATLVAVIGQSERHQRGAEVGEAEAERPVIVAVLRYGRRRIARVVDQDLLRRDEDARGGTEALDVERAVVVLELAEVEARQVAGRIVQKHVLGAWIAGVDRPRVLAGVPSLDGVLVLHTRVAADMRALGDLLEGPRGPDGLDRRAVQHAAKRVLRIRDGGPHEGIIHPHGLIHVLEGHAAVSRPVEGAVVALLDEGPRLLLLRLLGFDELEDVGMPRLQGLHDGGAARLAARLDRAARGILHAHKADRAGGLAAAGELLLRGAQLGPICAHARAELEQAGALAHELPDVVDRIVDGDDEARGGLRMLVGIDGDDLLPLLIPSEDGLAARVADAVLVVQAHIEPDGTVEGAVLMQAEPGQLVVEALAVLARGEIILLDAPVRDGARDAMDELLEGGFAPAP